MDSHAMNALHTLKWLHEIGVDEVITTEPINRFQHPIAESIREPKKAPLAQKTMAIKTDSPPILGSNESIKLAQSVVQNITDLDSLQTTLEAFTGCPTLKNHAKHTLSYTGNPNPTLLCIGDVPNENDEENGILLNGQNRTLLMRIIKTLGLQEEDIGYTNRTFWYAPGGRSITNGESEICMPFIKKIIELTDPAHILLLGNDTAKSILNTTENISKINGRTTLIKVKDAEYPCTPIFGFRTMFESPIRKKNVWQSIRNITIKQT